MEDFSLWVGIDLGSESHQACVIDRERKVLLEIAVEHSGKELSNFAARLLTLVEGRPERLAVAVETPRAAVVETLLDRGIAVFSLNPKQLDRFRDRHSVGGAKDDRRDAYVLADSLRTDQPSFRLVRLSSPQLVELREFSRLRDELMSERLALANRLCDHLNRYFPNALQLGNVYEARWIWALIERAPTPKEARRLALAKIRSLLQKHHVRSQTPESVREILSREAVHVAPGVAEAFSQRVMLLLPRLRLVCEQLAEVDGKLESILEQVAGDEGKVEHRDVALALSFPGIGTAVCAAMFGEAWQPLAERDYTTLAALCGTAPITKRSGKSTVVVMRQACNPRLRDAVHHWAHNAVINDAHARAHYSSLRGRGHKHARALRSVASRLLDVLLAMLRSGRPYDAAQRHRSLERLTQGAAVGA
jgi:transposase